MVNPINKVLEKTLQNLNLTHKIKEKKVLNIWSEVIGDKLKNILKLVILTKGFYL